jgi:hypothetical protein
MRVIDCDRCGETIVAANDSELRRNLQAHFVTEHEELSAEEADELIADEAYDATDS